jgi:hypothetical protein
MAVGLSHCSCPCRIAPTQGETREKARVSPASFSGQKAGVALDTGCVYFLWASGGLSPGCGAEPDKNSRTPSI